MHFSSLKFKYQFRKYQSMILDVIEKDTQKDNKFHIVAPPGSGKTIVGLELIRRFESPVVVFAPTTTIQVDNFQSDPPVECDLGMCKV